jgi:hypothetical protein
VWEGCVTMADPTNNATINTAIVVTKPPTPEIINNFLLIFGTLKSPGIKYFPLYN